MLFFEMIMINLAALSYAKADFVHPGILHTSDDLLRMRMNVAAQEDPWYSAYVNMSANSLASASYVMEGPTTYFERNHTGDQYGLAQIISDGRAAINLALRYYIEEDEMFANASRDILDAWSSTLTLVNGTDRQLGASLPGINLVNAAEILRYEWDGWSVENITRFETMINDLFVPAASYEGLNEYAWSGGWGTTGEKALAAYGVFLSNSTIYDEAISLYDSTAACGSLPFMISSTGQYVESGRDQGHTQLSIGNMAELSQIANSQGNSDVYDDLDERLMVGYEYVSEYLMTNNTLPYNITWVCCGCEDEGWAAISPLDRDQWRPVHEIAYGYFAQLKGLDMPYTKLLLQEQGLETINPVNAENDNAEWGTLRFRRQADLNTYKMDVHDLELEA